MKSLDRILELIRDSKWHTIEEVRKEFFLPGEKLDKILIFLQEETFIDKEHGRLRITSRGLKLLGLPA